MNLCEWGRQWLSDVFERSVPETAPEDQTDNLCSDCVCRVGKLR